MIEHYREGYDQVVARRTRDGDPAFRTALSRLYYRLVNKLVDVPMEDGVGDFRLLSRRAVDALLAMRESNRFSKGLFSWVGFPRYTIDYKNQERYGGGASRWSMRRLLNYGIDGIMSFNNAPLRVAIYFGFTITGLSLHLRHLSDHCGCGRPVSTCPATSRRSRRSACSAASSW